MERAKSCHDEPQVTEPEGRCPGVRNLQQLLQRASDLAVPPTHPMAGPGPIERSAFLYNVRRVRRAALRRRRFVDRENHAPLPLNELKRHLEGSGIRWRVSGMFCVNAQIGYVRAPHDLDIEIASDDAQLILNAMPTWEHFYVDNGAWIRWRYRKPPPDVRRFVSRRGPGEPWAVEWLATKLEGDEWVYRYDRSVRMPWMSDDLAGIPYSPPEIALLYKSRYLRDKDIPDFEAAAPLLDTESREWLTAAIAHSTPSHPWLSRLEELTSPG